MCVPHSLSNPSRLKMVSPPSSVLSRYIRKVAMRWLGCLPYSYEGGGGGHMPCENASLQLQASAHDPT